MKSIQVTMVRIYITESSHLLNQIIAFLKNEMKVRGVSVFRAISGYGESGTHTASLVDLSLDLPLTIEFFDDNAETIEKTLDGLTTMVKPEHIVIWDAKANL